MKNKKRIIITIGIFLAVLLIVFITIGILTDEDKLSSSERKWINNQLNIVQNVNVVNDVNIFGNTGVGVFYDFLNDLSLEYKLQINPVTYSNGDIVRGVTLGIKTNLGEDDQIFYEDHYVLVGKNDEIINSYQNFSNRKIGVLSSDAPNITKIINNSNITFTTYEDRISLLDSFKLGMDIDYLIVPLTMYLDEILKNDYYIVNHLSDVKLYYTISGDNSPLTNILKKYYRSWAQENLNDYFKRAEFNLFTTTLGITETEVDAMRSVTYQYGFINNSPYEVIMSGSYGGIIAMYLHDFSKFSGVEFNYTKYRDLKQFKNDIGKGNMDLYFNYYNLQDNYFNIDSKILVEYSVITNQKNNLVVNSINSLFGKTVYVQSNSYLATYLSSVNNIKIKTYENEKDLVKLNKQDVIILIDKNIFKLYASDKLSNYTEKFSSYISETYRFKSKTESAFYKLFNKFIMTLDQKEMIYEGMYNHSLTVKTGSILGTIAKYILLTLVVIGLLFIIFYHKSKKIKVSKKIRKENKLKFIDQLTTLKNRNYLNENLINWNNNTVYPQTMIVIDLNNVQFINDTLGYEEGDKQIKAAANILIKTQLDNSDIIRTDGNEFLIYLVGYTQKQVTNYIHKLNKEFKKLPYEYGAEFGYSMINDDIKTVEDAILEATEEMKKQKSKDKEE